MLGVNRRTMLLGAASAAAMVPGRLAAQEREAVIEAARKEGALAFAHSVSVANFPRFMQAFSLKYPFLETTNGLYSAPAGRVLARVESEIQSGNVTFDVLHVANLAPILVLARRGELLSYRSPELIAYPPAASLDNFWTTARIVGVIMAYNRNILSADKAPKAWVDMLRPEFKGRRLIIQDSAAGTAFNQMYILEKLLGVEFMRKWGAQEPIIVSTAPQLIDMLARGEALLGATVDHYRAFEPDAAKAGIVGIYPAEGMPLALAPVAIFKAARHPNAARLFVDFMLSEDGQILLNTELLRVYSMRNGVDGPAGQKPISETMPLLPQDLADYEKAAEVFPETFDSYFKS
jgi:iron(III) transport system substrate-binding protein